MEADLGGGGAGAEPFAHYSVTPARVRAVGDGVSGIGGDVENLDSSVGTSHRVALHGVAGLLSDPMLSAGGQVRDDTDRWLRSAVFGGGVIRLFGDGVETYNSGIDGLNQRYWSAKANQFGVPRPDFHAGMTRSERDELWAGYHGRVADAETGLLAELERERHTVLEPALDEHATWVAGLLDSGPDDAAAVVAAYQAGGLPLSAPHLFREVDFSGVDPELLYRNLVASGQIPADLEGMGEDELFEWFTDHPTEADLVAVLLLTPGSLTDARTSMVRALGRYDAWRVDRGLDLEPGEAGLRQIGDGSRRLVEINARLADGGRLTEAERTYLDAWFNEVGAGNLAALPSYVERATDVPSGMPSYAAQAIYDGYRAQYLTPVADAIMNLSNPALGGVRSLDEMPQAIQDLANTRIGDVPDTGLRWPSVDEYGSPTYGRTVPPDFTVDGLARYGGFVSLLEASTVDGGTVFTRELGESALRVKQDLNAIAANVTDALRWGLAGPDDFAALQVATRDDEVSRMLSVVARNEEAAGAMLLNDRDRPLLLGLNWYDDNGVVDVIRAGTDREGGGDSWMPAAATLAVMQEVGGDRDFYLDRMTEDMSDAVVDAGIGWMDTLGRPAGTESPSDYGMYTDALGNRSLGVQLSAQDRANFLEFVSGTGEADAMRFRAASVTYSQGLLTQAVATGDATVVNAALAATGRIDGAITAADYEFLLDREGDEYDEAKAAHDAEVRRNNGYRLAASVAWNVTSYGINTASGGSTSLFTSVAGTAVINPLINGIFDAGPPPVDHTAQTREELFDADRLNQSIERNYFLLSAYHQAGLTSPQQFPDLYEGGRLRPLEDLVGSGQSSNLLQDLQLAQDTVEQAWEAEPGRGDIDPGRYYDHERNSIANGSYWRDEPSRSGWTDEHIARQRLYGEAYVGDGDVDPLFEDRVTTDPDSYYRPVE